VLLVADLAASEAQAATPAPQQSVAFLGIRFLNDNAGLEPTTDAERTRLEKVAVLFKSKLEASGKYRFVDVPAAVRAKIDAGAAMGQCGGCEVQLGKELDADLVSWIIVQKVSNLILNMNVYMADVASGKMTFVHSVEIRGNTDESWTRSLNYLLDHYLLPTSSRASRLHVPQSTGVAVGVQRPAVQTTMSSFGFSVSRQTGSRTSSGPAGSDLNARA
jgi:hypothetical protein